MAGDVDILTQVVAPDLGGEPIVPGVETVEMAEAPFRKVSIRQRPDGILAVARHLDCDLYSITLSAEALVLVLESVEKPGNLGAILRTADGLGMEAVVVADPTTDVHNHNVVRASQGALFTVAVGVGTLSEVLAWTEASGLRLVAATPEAPTALWDSDLTGRVAVAVGGEARGLSRDLLAAAHVRVSIPGAGAVDSLNASVASALVMYEAVRQRRR